MMNVKICRFLSEDIGQLQRYEIINRKMVENRVKGIFAARDVTSVNTGCREGMMVWRV